MNSVSREAGERCLRIERGNITDIRHRVEHAGMSRVRGQVLETPTQRDGRHRRVSNPRET